MSSSENDRNSRYQASHEWVRPVAGSAEYQCGITHHAEHALGDVVFVELPAIGKSFKKGASFGVIESVKAASDLYIPMSGTITAINTALADNPGLVNADSQGEGWLIRFAPEKPAEWQELLDVEAYAKLIAEEA